MTYKQWMSLAACLILSGGVGCGSTSGGASTKPSPTSVTITGTVAGTVIVAVDQTNNEVARVTATGSPKSFSLEVPAGGTYRLYLIENEGTPNEKVFPLYQGSTNIFTIASAVTIDLGFVDTSSGRAVPANDPLAVTGVTSGGEDMTVPPSLIPASALIPLQVGNKWIYTSDVGIPGAYRKDEVLGAEVINNSLTYILERLEPAPDNQQTKTWLAYDGSWILLFRIWDAAGADPALEVWPPQGYVKLNPQVGDAWTLQLTLQAGSWTKAYRVMSIDDTLTLPAGTFTHCIRVTDESEGKVHVDYYAPGVGLVQREYPGHWVEELVYAKVGNQTYGVAP